MSINDYQTRNYQARLLKEGKARVVNGRFYKVA